MIDPRTALAGSCASSRHLDSSCLHRWARPRRPRRPRSPLGPACHGVQVAPGDDLQRLIDTHHRRSTFCFASGVYQLSGTVWTGSKFPRLDLRAGAVIDGQNGAFVGIDGADAPGDQRGTVILGGVFQHFGNEAAPSWVSPVIVRRNWLVVGSEFKDNFNAGLGIHPGRWGARVPSQHASQRPIWAGRRAAVRRLPRSCGRDHRGQRDRLQQYPAAVSSRRCRAARSSRVGPAG